MIGILIFCAVIGLEIWFVYLQIKKLRSITERLSYTGTAEGEILKQKHHTRKRWLYTVGYSAEGESYTFRFLKDTPKDPMPVGRKISVIYPADAPEKGCAENDTACFSHAYGLFMAHTLLIPLSAMIATPFFSVLMENPLGHRIEVICTVLWNLALIFMAAATIWFRIFWRTKSIKITGRVISTDYERRRALRQNVRYSVNGQEYVFSEIQTGWSRKVYSNGAEIPVRYLKCAPFAAECADHIELFPWFCVLFELMPTMMLVYMFAAKP